MLWDSAAQTDAHALALATCVGSGQRGDNPLDDPISDWCLQGNEARDAVRDEAS